MMNEIKEETCRCPECGRSGPKSDFMPKKYAGSASETTNGGKKHGLEIYIMGSKEEDEGTDEQENG